jgi:hypothetical protein
MRLPAAAGLWSVNWGVGDRGRLNPRKRDPNGRLFAGSGADALRTSSVTACRAFWDSALVRAGRPIRLLGVFPGETITLTNLDTGQSLTVGGTGSFQLRVEPDGSGSAMATGLGVWHDGNPVTGEPGLWYQSGRVSTTWDAEGNTTSLRSTGMLVNLCAELGS